MEATTASTDAKKSASSPAAGEVIVQTNNLSKTYRDFWGRAKVRCLIVWISRCAAGRSLACWGRTGRARSTTIKLLLGLLFPSSGQALVFGKEANDVSKNERLGYLPEESYLYKFLNAEETLDFYGRLFDMSAADRRRRVDELISLVGLEGARKRQLKEYSKGMARRVGLAQVPD